MDILSSKQDLITKTRKPYTITKLREKWTAEEHNRFLEAIKLHGRAWQRIEEHIGTKTAVQIRSHAQKFFSKLEKEAFIKGVPLGQAHDIDIPPPRPKRKPTNPYPRKTSAGTLNSSPAGVKDEDLSKSSSSSYHAKQFLDLENVPSPEKPAGTKKSEKAKEILDEDNCSEILTLVQEPPRVSLSSASKSSPTSVVFTNQCVFREFIPPVKETRDEGATDEYFLSTDPKGNHMVDTTDANYTDIGMSGAPNLINCCHKLGGEVVEGERTNELKQPEKVSLLSTEEIQASQSYPRHIPVHVVERSTQTCMQTPTPDMTCPSSIISDVEGTPSNPNFVPNPTASATTKNHSNISIEQQLPNFPSSINPLSNNQDSDQMYLNTTLSNLIVSTLLQNPAAHAAASFAASFWPCTNVEISVDSPLRTIGGFPLRQEIPSQSMSSIAAATVMAASAWWAAHGLLPFCPPLNAGFTYIPAPTNATPTDASLVLVNKEEKDHGSKNSLCKGQQLDTEFSKAFEPKCPDTKSLHLSLPDFNSSGGARSKETELEAQGHQQKPVSITGFHESDKVKNREQVDRSSCGSNTPSSSEVEMEMLEKYGNGKDESKEHNVSHRTSEPNNHRSRSTGNVNESWREVSEEGRLAFQALFSREVLPQSFSPPNYMGNKGQLMRSDGAHKSEENGEDKLQLDLNRKTLPTCLDGREMEKGELLSRDNMEKGLLSVGSGHGKLKACRIGFKPYKRCSVEAENRIMNGSNQGEERDPKRKCLEGADSTR